MLSICTVSMELKAKVRSVMGQETATTSLHTDYKGKMLSTLVHIDFFCFLIEKFPRVRVIIFYKLYGTSEA